MVYHRPYVLLFMWTTPGGLPLSLDLSSRSFNYSFRLVPLSTTRSLPWEQPKKRYVYVPPKPCNTDCSLFLLMFQPGPARNKFCELLRIVRCSLDVVRQKPHEVEPLAQGRSSQVQRLGRDPVVGVTLVQLRQPAKSSRRKCGAFARTSTRSNSAGDEIADERKRGKGTEAEHSTVDG